MQLRQTGCLSFGANCGYLIEVNRGNGAGRHQRTVVSRPSITKSEGVQTVMKTRNMVLILGLALVAGLVAYPALAQGPTYGGAPNYGSGAPAPAGGYSAAPTSFPASNPGTSATRTMTAAPNPRAGGIALVDVTYLFENCTEFQNKMASLKNEIEGIDTRLKGEFDAINALREELRAMTDVSPDSQMYREKENALAQRTTAFEMERNRLRRQLLIQEGRVYWQTFQMIQGHIQAYAKERGLLAVVRYDQRKVDENDPQTVLQTINRQIIYHEAQIEITSEILRRINSGAPRTTRLSGPGSPY